MKEQTLPRNTEAAITARSAINLSPFLKLAQRNGHRKLRIVSPTVPPRHFCLTDRAVRAALRAAEIAVWQATGGDYLNSVHQPVA